MTDSLVIDRSLIFRHQWERQLKGIISYAYFRPIADIEIGAANKLSSLRSREASSRPLSQLLNALLES